MNFTDLRLNSRLAPSPTPRAKAWTALLKSFIQPMMCQPSPRTPVRHLPGLNANAGDDAGQAQRDPCIGERRARANQVDRAGRTEARGRVQRAAVEAERPGRRAKVGVARDAERTRRLLSIVTVPGAAEKILPGRQAPQPLKIDGARSTASQKLLLAETFRQGISSGDQFGRGITSPPSSGRTTTLTGAAGNPVVLVLVRLPALS